MSLVTTEHNESINCQNSHFGSALTAATIAANNLSGCSLKAIIAVLFLGDRVGQTGGRPPGPPIELLPVGGIAPVLLGE